MPSGSQYSRPHLLTADGSGTSYAANASVTIDDGFSTGTTTLYAKWKDADTYKLSYNTNAGSETVTGDLPADTSYDADGISNVLNVTNVIPVRKGYTFTGWNSAADGSGTSYTAGQKLTVSKNTTLYAVWSQGSFALIYHFNGGTTLCTETSRPP